MADTTISTEITDINSQQPGPDDPNPKSNHPDPSPPPSSSSSTPSSTVPQNPNPTISPSPFISPPQPPSIQPYGLPQLSAVPPSAPSFRPAAQPVPLPTAPQFSPLPNSNFQAQSFQNPGVQPPGVGPVMSPYAPPGQPPNMAMRHYVPMPNGYQTMAPPAPQGTMPYPGMLRYPSPYTSMVRPAFPPRPPGAVGIIPALSRPPVMGIRGPIILPIVRPAVIPSVTPTEKPQTTVYVGKIASTVENDFILSLLQLCGPVKSWKRAQDPTNGALKGFGFCEFDSAEGVLRALRLLSKLNIDAQELMLNVNQATREYLESYVEKKKENSRNLKATSTEGAENEEEGNASGAEKDEPPKPLEDSKEDNKDITTTENNDLANFGLVTDEDREFDREALEKLTDMIEERLKTKPLPPPPPPPPPQTAADGSRNSNSELPARSRDGDSDVDIMKNDAAEDRNDDEMTSKSKPPSEHDKPETSSPDRSRRNDRRSRDRDRDMKSSEKERELERYEIERDQERAKRERDREYKFREDERRYRVRVKEWESRERERQHSRKLEKEREQEREQERKWEIMDQERESDDGYTKKRKYKSSGEERKKRQREKEEDLADRLKEEEEIAEANRKAEEERQQQKQEENDALNLLSSHAANGSDILPDETNVESNDKDEDQTSDGDSEHENHIDDGILQNGTGDESMMGSTPTSDARQSSNAPTRKLGFGLIGSGKRTAVPSFFHEEDEDAQKEKKMRPLVPIDYSTEEQQAVRNTISGAPSPNLVAAAEFAKRISHVKPKEDRPDSEKERSRRSHARSSQRDRDRDRNDEETSRTRDESRKETVGRDNDRERGLDKVKTPETQKLLDAKQLIDMIPKTKDELFSYEINWAIYDKNKLHERMKPWISKKITEFLGEEETTLVDYVVSSTQEHVMASEMLERLQAILDDEAEMFVLKMWRMLIFEVKRVETGLALRSKT